VAYSISLDELKTILALIIAILFALTFLVRSEPWSILTVLARRLVRIRNKWFNVNFKDDRRPLKPRPGRGRRGQGQGAIVGPDGREPDGRSSGGCDLRGS
jgi:hypothetical protein